MDIKLIGTSLLGFCLITVASPKTAQATCCEPQMVNVWVHGTYSNANQGDVIVNKVNSSDVIAPIIEAIGESHSHAMALFRTTGEVMHNVGDPNSVIKNWDCSHPLDPEASLDPMGPGAQIAVFADASYGVFQPAQVLHGAVKTTAYNINVGNYCVVWPLGSYAQPAVGYKLYGYSHNVKNGMCVEMLLDSCFVPRPAAKTYSASTVANAASATYNTIYGMAAGSMGWLASLYCPGAPRYAANQVVNTFLYDNPWDTNTESWQVPVTTVVTPSQLVATYPASQQEPAHLVPGYWTQKEERVCHPGMCY